MRRLLLTIAFTAFALCAFIPLTASASVVVNDEVTVDPYDWSTTWDDNQNNAYIDLINGLVAGDEDISLRDDYVNSEQFLNVVNRILQEHSELEKLGISTVTYTEQGYVDTVAFQFPASGSDPGEDIHAVMMEIADYTAFGKSYIDETMTDLEKALVLYDFVALRTFYEVDYELPYGVASGIYLDHKGDCTSIGFAYDQLLYSAGVPFGAARGHNHVWTNIYIDGKWYVSDATFATPTEQENVNYRLLGHSYFLCGTESHFEDDFHSYFNSLNYQGDEVTGIEYNNPTAYWDFSDSMGNIAYHAKAGETHGKFYYLTPGNELNKYVLTTRSSLYKDAEVQKYPSNAYENITWANDVLYGFRDNAIYTVDWETREETLIGYLENDTYYAVDAGGAVIGEQHFEKEVSGITGIIAENGKLTARINYADSSTEEITACTYDKVTFAAVSLSQKADLDGPSEEPSELYYDFLFNSNIQERGITVTGSSNTFVHTNGFEFPETVLGFTVKYIKEGAFKDMEPSRLAGKLTFNKSLQTIHAHAFENCTGISGALDVSHVLNIGNYAFNGCSGLNGKVILCPKRFVGQGCFQGCSGITEAENLSSVSTIHSEAFYGCSALSGCYDLSGVSFLGNAAFMDCPNLEIKPVIGASYIGDQVFQNCTKVEGEISMPNCMTLGSAPFSHTGVTRLTHLDNVSTTSGSLLSNTQLTGILSLPALTSMGNYSLSGTNGLDAIRLSNPSTVVLNDNLFSFPDSTDTALFVVKDSAVENIIKDKWTYGENYWYVNDVIASGQLDNGITWSIGGDGVMQFDVSDSVTEAVTVPSYSEVAAPWDGFSKYVETIQVDSGLITFGPSSICDFHNLETVTLVEGTVCEADAFLRCERVTVPEPVTCEHDWGTVTYVWADDNSSVTATRVCGHNDSHVQTETVAATSEVTTEPTCSAVGERTFTSATFKNEAFAVQTKKVEVPKTEHTWDDGTVTTEPTCSSEGVKTFKCTKCDATRTEPIDINADAHDWGTPTYVWVDDNSSVTATRVCGHNDSHVQTETVAATSEVTTEPTCTAVGERTFTSATFKNEAFAVQTKKVEVPKTDHTWDDGTVTTEPTCSSEGVKTFKCTACEATKTEPVDINPSAHEWDEGTMTTNPGCNSEGTKLYTCGLCGATREVAVDSNGHTPKNAVQENLVKATCTKDGSYDEVVYCEACNAELTRESKTIPAAGHDDPMAHTAAKAVTCTENGNSEYWYCSKCKQYFEDATGEHAIAENSWIIEAQGHQWNDGAVTRKASCIENGTRTFTCSVCDETRTEELQAFGHQWTHVKVAAGLLKNGSEYDKCVGCGVTQNYAVIPGWSKYYVKAPKAVAGKNSFTVKWKKQSKANLKKFNGYQIRYSTKKSMAKAKMVKVKKIATSKTIKKLKKKTKYYVQVRTYTVSKNVKYYSKWSAKKVVKTK